MDVPRTADVVVVGAGAFGASVTFHLARAGLRVVLVDRRTVVSQTSPRAAGIGMQIHANPPASKLGRRSLAFIADFESQTGETLQVWRSGSIKVALSAAFAEQVRREMRFGAVHGIRISELSAAEATLRAPFLRAGDAGAISFVHGDVQFEPAELPRAFIRAARRAGAEVLEGVEVTGVRSRGGAVTSVRTSGGTIATTNVVLAAGGWTERLAHELGLFVPVVAVRHQLLTTEPLPGLHDSQPTVRIMDANAYLRPYQGGLMFGAYEADPLRVDVLAEPGDYDIESVPGDLARLHQSMDAVAPQVPVLRQARVREVRAGLPTMTVDGKYIIDRSRELEGLFVIAGCCVTGLHVSPAVGADVSEWIVAGARPASLEPFTLSRFSEDLRSPVRLWEAAREHYEHKYQVFEEAAT